MQVDFLSNYSVIIIFLELKTPSAYSTSIGWAYALFQIGLVMSNFQNLDKM